MNMKIIPNLFSSIVGIFFGLYHMINSESILPTLESSGFLLWGCIFLIGIYCFNNVHKLTQKRK